MMIDSRRLFEQALSAVEFCREIELIGASVYGELPEFGFPKNEIQQI